MMLTTFESIGKNRGKMWHDLHNHNSLPFKARVLKLNQLERGVQSFFWQIHAPLSFSFWVHLLKNKIYFLYFWAQCTLYITYGKSDKSDGNGRRDWKLKPHDSASLFGTETAWREKCHKSGVQSFRFECGSLDAGKLRRAKELSRSSVFCLSWKISRLFAGIFNRRPRKWECSGSYSVEI